MSNISVSDLINALLELNPNTKVIISSGNEGCNYTFYVEGNKHKIETNINNHKTNYSINNILKSEKSFYAIYKLTPKGAKVHDIGRSKYNSNVPPSDWNISYGDTEYFVKYDTKTHTFYNEILGGYLHKYTS